MCTTGNWDGAKHPKAPSRLLNVQKFVVCVHAFLYHFNSIAVNVVAFGIAACFVVVFVADGGFNI